MSQLPTKKQAIQSLVEVCQNNPKLCFYMAHVFFFLRYFYKIIK